jgi:cilia- and flagella-associated protein 57
MKEKITSIANLNASQDLQGLVLATNTGYLKVFKQTYFNKEPYQNLKVHNGGVCKVKLSPNGRYIFTGGEDGTIFVFQVKNIDKNEFLEVLYPLQ